MTKLPVFVGLDYHQASVQVCVMNAAGKILVNRKCPNDWRLVAAVVRESGHVCAAIEACGGAADLADELVEQAGWSVDLAHPGYVHRLKQSPDKTDYSDAQLLADLERVGYLPRVWHAPQRIRELRRLVRYRQQLAAEHRSVKLRMKAACCRYSVSMPTSSLSMVLRSLPALPSPRKAAGLDNSSHPFGAEPLSIASAPKPRPMAGERRPCFL